MALCLVCGAPQETVLDFGAMPIANGFLTPDQFASEPLFPLCVGFCPACAMLQLTETVRREVMFNENYAFYSSTSTRMAAHFKSFADMVMADYLDADGMVVEIGSNDGIMLENFSRAGIRHLGIEPSANVAAAAAKKGVNTTVRFFDDSLADEILQEHGPVSAFLGANVMCHLPYINSVIAGIRRVLRPDGVLIFEDPYAGDIVRLTSYDQIYDEHSFYFSVTSVCRLFERHGMEVIDVIPQPVHGGSMRYVIGLRDARPRKPSVDAMLEKENAMGLDRIETYHRFRENVEKSRDQLMRLLDDLRRSGARVVGYGATSKSTTVITYCGITPEHLEFICDTTPIKQGKFSPGAHIPIKPTRDFSDRYPGHALLFAWNHAEEIMAKETAFRASGGRWIHYVPNVKVE